MTCKYIFNNLITYCKCIPKSMIKGLEGVDTHLLTLDNPGEGTRIGLNARR